VKDALRKFGRLSRLPERMSSASSAIDQLVRAEEANRLLLGTLSTGQVRALGPRRPLRDAEFRAWSQWGDDGIIQYLIQQIPNIHESFVEFGVEDYSEANTRFLLLKDNWRGLIMDGSRECMDRVRRSDIYWRHDLTAIDAFVTKDNINDLILQAGFGGKLGLLSIDIDGNDYWVWEALTAVDPAVVIVEYNSVFGPSATVTVPYDPKFRRAEAHSSYLYWGCSLSALTLLAERRGYVFVGCNSNGNNAYFVKRELSANVRIVTAREGYVLSRFRESRDPSGRLTYLAGDQRFQAIADMQVFDVSRNQNVRLGDT
jgi:hypothetical protein